MLLLIVLLLGVAAPGGEKGFDGWKRLEKGTVSFNHVKDPDFDDPTFRKPDGGSEAWCLSGEAKIGPEFGFNQRGCAIVRPAEETNRYTVSFQTVKTLKPLTRYEFGCKVKATGSDGRTSVAVGLEGLTVPIYKAWSGNIDWTDYRCEFTTKDGTNNAVSVLMFVRKGRWCNAMYDNFYIREVGGEYVVGLLNPFGRVTAEDPDLLFAVNTIGAVSYEGCDRANVFARVTVTSAAGATLLDEEAKVTSGRFSITAAGKLPRGVYSARAVVFDKANKLVLAEEKAIRVQSGEPDVPRPVRGAATFDRHGRMIVDGKPFMPLAVYVGGVALYEIDWFRHSDFNTFLAYSGFLTKVRQTKAKPGRDAMIEDLDFIDEAGLKIILSASTFFPKYDGPTTKTILKDWGLDGKGLDYDEAIACMTEEVRSHPAVLGYYITDELPPERYGELLRRRETFNRVDPWHPTTGVYFRLAELAAYTGTADAPSIDFYPISGKGKPQSQRLVSESMDAANACWARQDTGAMPFWATLQMFSWKGGNPDENSSYRMPTLRESIAMAYMSAIGGAKGFIWYYFFDICHATGRTAEEKFPRFERNWAVFREVAHEMKLLEPFIMSAKPAPKVSVKDIKGRTRARAFVDDEYGRLRVLVSCDGPGDSEAEITVEGENGLLSKFENTKAEKSAGGRTVYRFKGRDVDCDLLQRWPEAEFNKRLK